MCDAKTFPLSLAHAYLIGLGVLGGSGQVDDNVPLSSIDLENLVNGGCGGQRERFSAKVTRKLIHPRRESERGNKITATLGVSKRIEQSLPPLVIAFIFNHLLRSILHPKNARQTPSEGQF